MNQLCRLIKRAFINSKGSFLSNIIILLVGIVLLMGSMLCKENSNPNIIFLSIGTSVIAASIVAFLDMLRGEAVREVYDRVDEIIIEGGIDKIYHRRDLDEYKDLVHKAKKSIDITGYSLKGFYESNKDEILKKCLNNPDFLVRIILVNPNSNFSIERDVEENFGNPGMFKVTFDNLKNWSDKVSNIQIRLINSQLSDMIYRIDDYMYTGPYFYKKSSKETYTNKLNKKGWLFKAYQENFDEMWKDATEIERVSEI